MFDQTNFSEPKNHREAGFSFIELMISLTVFAIFSVAIFGLLRIANIQKSTINSQTEVSKNLRLSLNTIGRDAVNAGLGYSRIGGNMPDNLTNVRMGLPADANTTQDLLTGVISGNDINPNNFLPSLGRTDVISFAFQVPFADGSREPVPIIDSAVFGTTGVTLTTAANAAVNVRQYDLLLVSQGTARTAMALVTTKTNDSTLQIEFGASADPIGTNAPFIGTTDSKSRLTKCASGVTIGCMNYPGVSAKKVYWVSYSVTTDGTLVRTTYGNNTGATMANQIQTQPIAYNIQNFQVRYLLRDGTFTDNPSNNGANQEAMNNVVQIQVTVSARVSVQENGVNLQTVENLKSTFSTRNLNYDAN